MLGHRCVVKRSANRMANCFFVARQVMAGIFQFFAMLRKASQISFFRRLVVGEVATILDDLTRLHIQAFDGVGRVHDPTNLSNYGIFHDGRCGRGDAMCSHEASEGRFVMISNNCRECMPDLLKCFLAHQMRVDASSNVGAFNSNSIAAVR